MEKTFTDTTGDIVLVEPLTNRSGGVYISFHPKLVGGSDPTDMTLDRDTAVALAEYILRVSRKNV